jgi:hypothetical protein
MKACLLTLVLPLFVTATSIHASEDRSIWLQAGQCVVVGGQQVCAQKAPGSGDSASAPCSSPQAPSNKITHHCKNGIKDEANPKVKGWAHVIITRSPDGKKLSEEVEKTYGPLGKDECLSDLERARSAN